ncbi:MAG: hypothetical protein ACI381_07785 [Candidatus Methanomethylophilaceae archaeon]
MYSMPSGYSTAVGSSDRVVSAQVVIGANADGTAADDISSVSSTARLPMSNVGQLTDMVYTLAQGLATYEGDGIPTSVGAMMIAPPVSGDDTRLETGVWSNAVSGSTGSLSFTLTLNFNTTHTSAVRVYTNGPKVTAATITFGSTAVAATCYDGYFEVPTARSYSTLAISVMKIAEAYMHLRIVEIEFGSSLTLSSAKIAGTITAIDEMDPSELSIPMSELDVSLINVLGEYDADNPDTLLGEVAIGTPINLNFVVASGSASYTVPFGRYVVTERTSSDTQVTLVAFDHRSKLSGFYRTVEISTSTSLGDTIDEILTYFDVPHSIDTSLFTTFPWSSHTFDESTSILDDLLCIQQAYGIYFLADRDGTIHVTGTWPTGQAGTVDTGTIYKWPSIQQTTRYNFISVSYGKETYDLDLRPDGSQDEKSLLLISNNPLIPSASVASAVASRISAHLHEEETETEWRGDPAMDLGDYVTVPGKWTQTSPRTYRIRRREISFDGVMRQKIRGTR